MAIKVLATIAPWYKATVTDNTIPGIPKGTKVWFKLNTERPLNSGPTYWVYDHLNKVLRHVAESVGNELLDGVKVGKGWSIATEDQAKILKAKTKPLIDRLVNSKAWKGVGKPPQGPSKMGPPRYEIQRSQLTSGVASEWPFR